MGLAVLARGVGAVAIAAGLVFLAPGGPVAEAAGAADIIETAQTGLKLVASDGILTEGAVAAAVPEATLACVGPQVAICATVGVVVAGAVLYATQDTWMPWLKNTFGQGGNSTGVSLPGIEYTETIDVSSDQTSFTLIFASSGAATMTSGAGATGQCKDGTTGALTSGGIGNFAFYVPGGGSTGPISSIPGYESAGRFSCAAGSKLISAATYGRDWDGHFAPTVNWGAAFDPATGSTVTTTVDCVKPDGTIGTVSVNTINPDGGVLVPSCVQAFGPGSHGTKISLDGGATGAPVAPISTITVPTTSTLYPNCVGGGVGCTYVVKYRGNPCVVGQAECVDWALQSQVDGNTDYTCFYGPYSMPLAGCALDERAYENTPHRLSKLNTDGNPMTWDGPRPSWVTDPNLSGDPGALPLPGTLPYAPPAGAPGGDPLPLPGDPLPAPTPGAAPSATTDCWPGGSAAWNPIAWVMQPVQCALAWAFVPTTAVDTSLVTDQLNRAGIAPSVAALTTAVTSLGGTESGCEGPAIAFDIETVHQSLHPFAACTAPMSTVAGYSYAFVSVVVVIGGAGKIISLIAHGFGYGGPPPTWQQGTLF